MSMAKWGFVYTVGGPDLRRDELGSEDCRLVALGIPDVSGAVDAAVELVAEGCELVEFCGAFGAVAMADVVLRARELGVPVGQVTYGTDAASGLNSLFG